MNVVPVKITLRPARLADAAEIATLTNELGYAADEAAIRSRLESVLENRMSWWPSANVMAR